MKSVAGSWGRRLEIESFLEEEVSFEGRGFGGKAAACFHIFAIFLFLFFDFNKITQ